MQLPDKKHTCRVGLVKDKEELACPMAADCLGHVEVGARTTGSRLTPGATV